MRNLSVPFVYQYNSNACGAAALEIIYKYFGLTNISQEEIFEKYKKLEPHGSGNYYISTGDLISDAKSRDFYAEKYQLNYNSIENISLLKEILQQELPIIVCQQYTKEKRLIGHFRVIIGIDNEYVYFHDPSPKIGGENLKQSYREFFDYWQPTGKNVIGGRFYIISKTQSKLIDSNDLRIITLKK